MGAVPADRRAYPKSGRSLGIKYKIGSAALRTLFLQQSECFYSPTGTEAAPKSRQSFLKTLCKLNIEQQEWLEICVGQVSGHSIYA